MTEQTIRFLSGFRDSKWSKTKEYFKNIIENLDSIKLRGRAQRAARYAEGLDWHFEGAPNLGEEDGSTIGRYGARDCAFALAHMAGLCTNWDGGQRDKYIVL